MPSEPPTRYSHAFVNSESEISRKAIFGLMVISGTKLFDYTLPIRTSSIDNPNNGHLRIENR